MASETSRVDDGETAQLDAQTAVLYDLHGERAEIERALVLAQQRQLY